MPTTQQIIDNIRKLHPSADSQAPLTEQVRAIVKRGKILDAIWKSSPYLQGFAPDGFWEQDIQRFCFCNANPSGHEVSTGKCLFRDGQQSSALCPACRQPAAVKVWRDKGFRGYVGSAPAYEPEFELSTRCCGEWPTTHFGTELDDRDE